jgi:hypothetical protein
MKSVRRIFISYDYTKDHDLKKHFVTQAEGRNLPVALEDFSLQEDHRDPRWVEKARGMIRQCSLVVVLLGEDTHSASGVRKEVDIARSYHIRVILIRSQRAKKENYGSVRGVDEEYPWKWSILDEVLAPR